MSRGVRVLAIGDIVGRPGRGMIARHLRELREREGIDFVVGNAENVSGGAGLRPEEAEGLFDAGLDVATTGDHVWSKREIIPYIDKTDRVLRAANYPAEQPGRGHGIYAIRDGLKVGVIHVQLRVFMTVHAECPFRTAERLAAEIRKTTPIVVVDAHGEATSEKIAIGWYLDGKVSFLFGTHTHIPTADERVLPQGTAYITDVGMTGPYDSVIGRAKEPVLKRFLTQMPHKFDVATDDPRLCAAMAEIDPATGRATSIRRIMICESGEAR